MRDDGELEQGAVLRSQLFQSARRLRDDPLAPCACYHPSADWLREHGFDPQKAKAVEIAHGRELESLFERAKENSKEYFAEASEAWLGTNDFFPFVKPELCEHDPDLAAFLAKVWGDPIDSAHPR